MAIELKRQQLLDKNPTKKKPKATAKPIKEQQSEEQRPQQKVAVKKKGSLIKKTLGYLMVLVIFGLIIVPKPQLLVYKKLNLVANSIYLPGWFGRPGKLLDSTQRVVIDEQLGLVYLCFKEQDPREKCNRYQFLEQKGLFSALIHYSNQ